MIVYFLRHAHAEESDGRMPDAQRQLTERGIRHTRRLARMLKRMEVEPDRLVSSPLTRARQTAEIVSTVTGLKVEIRDELSPGFNLAGLQAITRSLGMDDSVMIVGHEPDFSKVMASLIGGGRIIMKKGGLARIDVTAYQPLRGELMWLMTPKLFEQLG